MDSKQQLFAWIDSPFAGGFAQGDHGGGADAVGIAVGLIPLAWASAETVIKAIGLDHPCVLYYG